MHLLAKIPYASVQLRWSQDVTGPAQKRASQLRGALANAFAKDNLFHQHDEEGKPLYRYPHVQYRWQNDQGIVVGWRDAAERLLQAPWLDLSVRLGDEEVVVSDAVMTTNHSMFAVSEQLQHYCCRSPVLLFNQQNYRRYEALAEREQLHERNRLLVAQLLTAMRGLEVNFPTQLYAAFTRMRTRLCRYKQQDLMGVQGVFVTNVTLPEGFAIGHAVSHGYGWLAPIC